MFRIVSSRGQEFLWFILSCYKLGRPKPKVPTSNDPKETAGLRERTTVARKLGRLVRLIPYIP
jgi:hypothetical protein